jgi:hypothetical protein
MRLLVIVISLVLCSCATAPGPDEPPPNARLMQLFEVDQSARTGAGAIDWSALKTQDAERRAEVMQMLRSGQLRHVVDFSNAALIFLHGETADDIRLAFSFAWIARSLAPEFKEYNMPATAWDRILMFENQPQWYGTQYTTNDKGRIELYRVNETAVTDTERARMGVPPLSEAKARAKTFEK